jgi:AcrR family transcriptional regulator
MPSKPRTAPRKTPTQARSRATVDAILEATARLLVKHGFDRTSTNLVAEAAGVSIGSLYQYFPSKEALVSALLDQHHAEMRAVLVSELERVRRLPLPDAVRAVIEAMLEAHAVDPALHRVLMEQVPKTGRPGRGDFDREILLVVKAYLHDRRAELGVGDVELTAFLLVVTVEAVTHAAVLHYPERLKDRRLTDELTAMVLGYLTGNAAAPASLRVA